VIFISDHGESLGEGGLYMHGVPLSMAPDEQLDIPFIVWTSDNSGVKVKNVGLAGHHHVYHSVLKFLGMKTSFYDESKNIFE
jgi:lipid A ethanolaminephosphotransferase